MIKSRARKPWWTSPLLDRQVVFAVYRELVETGDASCEKAAKVLAQRGMITPRTGRPPTRKAVYYLLSLTAEGRELLGYTKRRIGRTKVTENSKCR